jgi:hypothetical protein
MASLICSSRMFACACLHQQLPSEGEIHNKRARTR